MADEPLDLYAVLRVARTATQSEIARAYRELVRRYHPDTRAGGDADKRASDAALQQVLAAYTLLRDPRRRAAYDRSLNGRSRPTGRGPADRPATVGDDVPIRAGPVHWRPAGSAPPGGFRRRSG